MLKDKKKIQNGVLYGEVYSLWSITVRGVDLLCSSSIVLVDKLCHLFYSLICKLGIVAEWTA